MGDRENLGQPIDWRAIGKPLLWRFNLHYQHYLYLLDAQAQVRMCRAWVARHARPEGVGWHPYPTSLRIANWCKSAAILADPVLAASLYSQVGYLYRHLEFYHPGNHYLENARALVLAGRAFEGQGEAQRWLEKGLKIFRKETPDQILPDGGYFERTPMYHALMLEAYLDVLNVLPPDHPDAMWLRDTVAAMSSALQAMCHPDGQIALFNDATLEVAPSPTALLSYAEAVLGQLPGPVAHLPDTGLYRYEDDTICLLVDAGPIGPDYLPAHAHADIFTYELSVGGEHFVTDTGVFEYAGPRRAYDRSTAAHNTAEVDGVSQAECWGSFRVARRYPPQAVSCSEDGTWTLSGRFDGYADLIGDGIQHRRVFEAEQGRVRVVDEVVGQGVHDLASRIHLHPDIVASSVDGGSVRLRGKHETILLEVEGAAIDEEATPFSPRFGVSCGRTTLVLRTSGPLPLRLAYTFLID
ncbi:MAG: alginate lyase family protein [Bacteroidota bacterium]